MTILNYNITEVFIMRVSAADGIFILYLEENYVLIIRYSSQILNAMVLQ